MDLGGVMGKKKRQKLFSVLAVIEGEREATLLKYLKEIYLDATKIKFTEEPPTGGNPNWLLDKAIKKLYCGYDRIFLWIDEDVDIEEEGRRKLFKEWRILQNDWQDFYEHPLADLQEKYNSNNHNPILIVSQPVSVEALILNILGKHMPQSCLNFCIENREQQLKDLKNCVKTAFNVIGEPEYYRQNLSKDILEIRRKEIKELDLLISMLLKP